MRLPRMTTRRWMIAVAVVVIVTLACRHFAFRALAVHHRSKTTWSIAMTNRGCISKDHNGKRMTGAEVNASPWHEEVSTIYERAAARPWLPVEPIPPEPPPPTEVDLDR